MRKVITALIATAAGLVALLSFRSHAGAAAVGIGAPLAPAGSAATASADGAPSAAPATSAAHVKDGHYTGDSAPTEFGPVQVAITVSGGKLTDVSVLEVPDSGRYEQQIVSVALPTLRTEALSRQNANIDIVSGATYTSQGYSQSLQSALDQAGL